MNQEQSEIYKKSKNGTNLFITGSAGVGKSYLLKEIINNTTKKIGVCALTGAAAVLINGTTLHSFMGIGLGTGNIDFLLNKIKKNGTFKKLSLLEVLIVDEVSMLGMELFQKINEIFKIIKKNKLPFGGIQIVLVGDPFQLAPVKDDYCFLSRDWDSLEIETCKLTENMRSNQLTFKNLLDNLRVGLITDQDYLLLKQMTKTEFDKEIIPTKLFSKNVDSESVNEYELRKLIESGAEKMVYPIIWNSHKKKDSQKYVNSTKINESIELCLNAQVVVTRNLDIIGGIINGTRGVITKLMDIGIVIKLNLGVEVFIDYYKHKSDDPEEYIEFEYMPIKLGWAISIHSSQGMTLDALEIDLGNSVFACGQGYTGLSRARNMESVKITKLSRSAFKTDKRIIEFYSK